jgi:radical SAM protein with 4Fe4S-binding SPASM domain
MFEKNSIKAIQIQTIDNCNLRCKFCPNAYRQPSGVKMEDWVFEKIVEEIKPYIQDDVEISLFLENEPLLDKKIFKRVEYIKKEIPGCELYIVTNGVFTKQYKEEILKYFDKFNMSFYGKTHKQFNRFTGSNVSKEFYNTMLKENYELADTMDKTPGKTGKINDQYSFLPEIPGRTCYSRAGFINKWKKLTKNKYVHCGKREPYDYFNFLVDGSMILCCMDYIKESAFGNIKEQTLEEIFKSNRAKTMLKKARGDIASEENFICKRCLYSYKESM